MEKNRFYCHPYKSEGRQLVYLQFFLELVALVMQEGMFVYLRVLAILDGKYTVKIVSWFKTLSQVMWLHSIKGQDGKSFLREYHLGQDTYLGKYDRSQPQIHSLCNITATAMDNTTSPNFDASVFDWEVQSTDFLILQS
ncbi:hypothetical protein TNCV_256481 [Trichonephila clavipes]|nr:hypothetical protein TNCV_256481 [Trichonephila clavipes]